MCTYHCTVLCLFAVIKATNLPALDSDGMFEKIHVHCVNVYIVCANERLTFALVKLDKESFIAEYCCCDLHMNMFCRFK